MRYYHLLVIFVAMPLALEAQYLRYSETMTWESKAGNTIDARFVCVNDNEVWLLGKNRKLYKISPFQLTKDSRDKVEEEQEKQLEYVPKGLKASSIVADDAKSLKLAEILVTTTIPSLKTNGVTVKKAVEAWAVLVEEMSASAPEIVVEFAKDEFETREVSIELRGLDAARTLDFMIGSVGLYYRLDNGKIIIDSI